jgi:hypothetical protein
MALADKVSREDLDDLFDVWLFTAEKPPPSAVTAGQAQAARSPRAASESWRDVVQQRLRIGRY